MTATFDYPALAALALLVHDLDGAQPWPAALLDDRQSWTDPADSTPLQLCRHAIGGATQALYGFVHAHRVIVCTDCFRQWRDDFTRTLDGRCQLCAAPDAMLLHVDAGYLTLAAQLCVGCRHHTEGES